MRSAILYKFTLDFTEHTSQLRKIDILIMELLRYLEQCIYPLELNRKQK